MGSMIGPKFSKSSAPPPTLPPMQVAATAASPDGSTAKASMVATAPGSAEVVERIKNAISDATTFEEVSRLEAALKTGVIPEDLRLAKASPPAGLAPAVADDGNNAGKVEPQVGGSLADAN